MLLQPIIFPSGGIIVNYRSFNFDQIDGKFMKFFGAIQLSRNEEFSDDARRDCVSKYAKWSWQFFIFFFLLPFTLLFDLSLDTDLRPIQRWDVMQLMIIKERVTAGKGEWTCFVSQAQTLAPSLATLSCQFAYSRGLPFPLFSATGQSRESI